MSLWRSKWCQKGKCWACGRNEFGPSRCNAMRKIRAMDIGLKRIPPGGLMHTSNLWAANWCPMLAAKHDPRDKILSCGLSCHRGGSSLVSWTGVRNLHCMWHVVFSSTMAVVWLVLGRLATLLDLHSGVSGICSNLKYSSVQKKIMEQVV